MDYLLTLAVFLYKQGTPVGGIGFIGDGIYGLIDISQLDDDLDEIIALAGTVGFGAPSAAGRRHYRSRQNLPLCDWDTSFLLSDADNTAPICF